MSACRPFTPSPTESLKSRPYKPADPAPLELTDEEIRAFDPLTAAAARLMVKHGTAVLVAETETDR